MPGGLSGHSRVGCLLLLKVEVRPSLSGAPVPQPLIAPSSLELLEAPGSLWWASLDGLLVWWAAVPFREAVQPPSLAVQGCGEAADAGLWPELGFSPCLWERPWAMV